LARRARGDSVAGLPVGPLAAWWTLEALEKVHRPLLENVGMNQAGQRRVAWKTGTSFGFRDAWSVGTDGKHVVAVWAGNADGSGRPGLTGIDVAAPLLFRVMSFLPPGQWPREPAGAREQSVCAVTGYPAGSHCPVRRVRVPASSGVPVKVPPCPYHQRVHLNAQGQLADARCAVLSSLNSEIRLVLPPGQEAYYRRFHPEYHPLPDWALGCAPETRQEIEVLYPLPGSRIALVADDPLQQGLVVLEAAHRFAERELLWYIDGRPVGTTRHFHRLTLSLEPGQHVLEVMDQAGARVKRSFEVVAAPNL
jgi:penicillin-binding protein 1C